MAVWRCMVYAYSCCMAVWHTHGAGPCVLVVWGPYNKKAVVWLYIGCMAGQAVWGCMGPIQQENGVSWGRPVTKKYSFESSMALLWHTMHQLHNMTHIHLQASRLNSHTFLIRTEKSLYGCMVAVWVFALYGPIQPLYGAYNSRRT